jgi:hypothetical protein
MRNKFITALGVSAAVFVVGCGVTPNPQMGGGSSSTKSRPASKDKVTQESLLSASDSDGNELKTVTPELLLDQSSKVGEVHATPDKQGPGVQTSSPANNGQQATVDKAAAIAKFQMQASTEIYAAQAKRPDMLSRSEADEIVTALSDLVQAADNKKPALAAASLNKLNKKIYAISRRKRITLGLYDNSTLSGRIMNGFNGLFDVGVQLYGALIAFDGSQVGDAGQNALKAIMNMISF